jgi:DNA-binding beta-propeller fold protein YncE
MLYAGEVSTGRVALKKMLSGTPQGMALDHAGKNLYVGSSTGEVWRLDPASLRTVQHAHFDCVVQDVKLSIDDAELYVACDKSKGSVVVLDPKTLTPITTIPLAGAAFGLGVTPDNAQLYITMPALGGLVVLDRATRTCIRGIAVHGAPRRVAFSPTGDKAYVSNEWNWVAVFK